MDIAALNEKISIQKNTTVIDAIGNHSNEWTDYFTCYATVGGEESAVSGESEAAGQIVDNSRASFTIRWCSELDDINTTDYRVCFRNELYDITGVNHQSYKRKSIKLMCKKCRR